MASLKRNLSLLEEEKLVEIVRNYPILYDKSHQGYKGRDAVRNAWREVAMSLEFIDDGDSARQYFDVFKKRYLRKRGSVKKASKSGTSSASVQKAKKDFEPHLFFSWIDPCRVDLKTRTTKSNVSQVRGDRESVTSQMSDRSDLDSEQEEDDKDSSIDQVSVAGNNDPNEQNDPVLEAPREAQHASKRKPDRKFKSSKLRKLSSLDDKQMHLMEEMEKNLM